MTTEQIVGLTLTVILMMLGVAGSILPALPSTPLVFLAALGHKLYFGEASAGWWMLILLALITLLSLLMDHLATLYGAKRFGATWRGAAGAVCGCVVGLFFNLPGLLFGPFIGAMLFELAGGRNWTEASRAGVGATLGLLAGAVGKLACSVAMTGMFTAAVVWTTVGSTVP